MAAVHSRACMRLVLPALLAAGPAWGEKGGVMRASAVWPEAAWDAPERAGLARMLAGSFAPGCGARAGRDALELVVEVPRAEWREGLDRLAACLQGPRLEGVVVDAARRALLDERRARTPAELAIRVVEDLFWAGHPYGVDPLGTDATLDAIDRDLVAARFAELGAPAISATGVDRALLERRFPRPSTRTSPSRSTSTSPGTQVFVYQPIDRAEVAIALRAPVKLQVDGALRLATATVKGRAGEYFLVTLSARPDQLAAVMATVRTALGASWDDAVIATVMPPAGTPEAVKRARGVVRKRKPAARRKRR
ncbi:MAG TPA: hypothetical protein VMZ28_27685 [Kofleriaceae bacterium]|nr:hypothetical protein [Kofleriaceae bacterium]